MIRVRFAPSPTGYIHIGNSRIALANWLFALEHNGEFILRYDDTDVERSRQEYVEAIAQDLGWLGIKPTQIHFQSHRFERYDQVVEDLKKTGQLYPCYETAEELERRRKILLSRKLNKAANRIGVFCCPILRLIRLLPAEVRYIGMIWCVVNKRLIWLLFPIRY